MEKSSAFAEIAAVIGVRFLGLRSVFICSATENSKSRVYFKNTGKRFKNEQLDQEKLHVSLNILWILKIQWISEQTSCSWIQTVKMWSVARPKKKTWIWAPLWVTIMLMKCWSGQWAFQRVGSAGWLHSWPASSLENRSWSFVILHTLFLRGCSPKIT